MDPRETPTQPIPEIHIPIGNLVAELRRLFRVLVVLCVLALAGIAWMVYRSHKGRALQVEILNRLPAESR